MNEVNEMYQIKDIENTILCGNALTELKKIPNETIDTVITSPPYWALRNYSTDPQVWGGDVNCEHVWVKERTERPNASGGSRKRIIKSRGSEYVEYKDRAVYSDFCEKCGAWKGELGQEPDFLLYVDHLVSIFDEVKRILKPTGTLFVNIGDTYNGNKEGKTDLKVYQYLDQSSKKISKKKNSMLPVKCLCQIPSRFSIAMTDRGWTLRNELIWVKPNSIPSSVKDRFSGDFEKIFFFVKSRKYYFEQQFEPVQEESVERLNRGISSDNKWNGGVPGQRTQSMVKPRPNRNHNECDSDLIDIENSDDEVYEVFDPSLGRNKRCVWSISTKPFKDAHFATFPKDLVQPMVLSGCPEFICTKCGKAREKIYEPTGISIKYGSPGSKTADEIEASESSSLRTKQVNEKKFSGYSKCECNEKFEGGIVVDPFAGSGTTCAVAKELGRKFIGIDLNPKYIKMAKNRLEGIDEESLFTTGILEV